MGGRVISFGPFRLHTEQRLLLEGDRPVRLGSRAFDILAALVERTGEVVGKEQLIARAWPRTFVEDSNLKIQMNALRRALGDGQVGQRYIVTVPGRGYSFVAPVRREEMLSLASAPPAPSTAPHNLPFAVTRTIGRDEAMAALVARLARERLVTIVGPGGIGKTTVALAVAERLMASYEHGVWLVDLARLADPCLVPSAVATVLGLEIRTTDPLHGLAAAVRDKRMLLLLDTCEHVVDAAASLAAVILGAARGVTILATSRESLAVAGEGEYRLAPLGVPKVSPRLTAAEAAPFPAVQLFVERVSAIVEDFALTDANAPAVAEICRRLDGLPLAIEFAAPRVEALGVEGLAARLDDSLQLLEARRRTTMPRQRTMRAVVDWSYGLLSGDDQRFFRALGIFRGVLTVEAAASVALDGASAGKAIDRLADLVAKSLVAADVSGPRPLFRLLDTTRAYAIDKLDSDGERQRIARRHAEYYLTLVQRSEAEAPARPAAEWLADYAAEIDNVRSALDWAFSPAGDQSLGVALTAATAPLWLRLSLLEECRTRVKHALRALAILGATDSREEMRLHTALGDSAPEPPEAAAAFTTALEIAEALDDAEHQLLALRGLNHHSVWTNQFRAALSFAQRFHDLSETSSDQSNRRVGERLLGTAKLLLGDFAGARRHLEQALARPSSTANTGPGAVRLDDVIRLQYDGQVAARVFLTDVLWRQGFPDQAVRMAEENLAEAKAIGHVVSQCLALSLGSCPSALWIGDLAAAAEHARLLFDLSTEHGLPTWLAYAARYRRVIALKGGDAGNVEGTERHDAHLRSLTAGIELAEALGKAGRTGEGLAVLDGFAAQTPELGGFAPEFLRLRGELLSLQTAPATAKPAEDLFREALDVAHQHGALSLELRAAMSLARLLRDRGRQDEAIDCLQPVYARFTEGFDTADLIAAKRLLDELADARRLTPRRSALDRP